MPKCSCHLLSEEIKTVIFTSRAVNVLETAIHLLAIVLSALILSKLSLQIIILLPFDALYFYAEYWVKTVSCRAQTADAVMYRRRPSAPGAREGGSGQPGRAHGCSRRPGLLTAAHPEPRGPAGQRGRPQKRRRERAEGRAGPGRGRSAAG